MAAAVTTIRSTYGNHLFEDRVDVADIEETEQNPASSTDSLLVVSPYISPPHLLDLTRYSTSSQLFAKALTKFQPVRGDYATAEYIESFNFPEVIETLRSLAKAEGYNWKKTDFYVVSFRSQLKPNADPERLFELDAFSHQEAMASGGLLRYWYGVKDQNRRNLATCFWESRQHARDGGRGPWHAIARAAATVWYESIVFKTYVLTIADDIESWAISDFEGKRS